MSKRLRIGARWIGEGEPCYIIAEAGSNHNGSLEQALALIDVASEAGADAVKFQGFRARTLYPETAGKSGYLKDDRPIYDIIRAMEMPLEWIPDLAKHCAAKGVDFICTPFDEAWVEALDPYVPAFKVASYELSHLRVPKLLGCTAGVRWNDGLGMVHLRTLDWPLPSITEATRLFRFRRGSREFVVVGACGHVGVLSGMLPKAYSVTINWAPPTDRDKIDATGRPSAVARQAGGLEGRRPSRSFHFAHGEASPPQTPPPRNSCSLQDKRSGRFAFGRALVPFLVVCGFSARSAEKPHTKACCRRQKTERCEAE